MVTSAIVNRAAGAGSALVAYLLAGVIAALVFGVWMERLPVTPHPVSWSEAFSAAVFALPGALVAAAVFWRLAVRPRLTNAEGA